MIAKWCMQCGEENRPEMAVGVDADGEPACAVHKIQGGENEMPDQTKSCGGVLDKPCPASNIIGSRAEVCGACYARRLYHQKKNGGERKLQQRKKPRANGQRLNLPQSPSEGVAFLFRLKAKLLAQLAAIELVEKLAVVEPE